MHALWVISSQRYLCRGTQSPAVSCAAPQSFRTRHKHQYVKTVTPHGPMQTREAQTYCHVSARPGTKQQVGSSVHSAVWDLQSLVWGTRHAQRVWLVSFRTQSAVYHVNLAVPSHSWQGRQQHQVPVAPAWLSVLARWAFSWIQRRTYVCHVSRGPSRIW